MALPSGGRNRPAARLKYRVPPCPNSTNYPPPVAPRCHYSPLDSHRRASVVLPGCIPIPLVAAESPPSHAVQSGTPGFSDAL
jgi:hypothetical protein